MGALDFIMSKIRVMIKAGRFPAYLAVTDQAIHGEPILSVIRRRTTGRSLIGAQMAAFTCNWQRVPVNMTSLTLYFSMDAHQREMGLIMVNFRRFPIRSCVANLTGGWNIPSYVIGFFRRFVSRLVTGITFNGLL